MDGTRDRVRLEDVTCRFGDGAHAVLALDRVTVGVGAGMFVAVMGATGSGKSTLLNCAAGLGRPTAGMVHLVGRRTDVLGERALTRLRRDHVGFVFQSYNLLSELTVAQNVLLPRRLGAPRGRSLADVLAAVGLAGFEDRAVGELSGGQRQRVAVARALSTRPRVIFADEPTGALDPTTGAQVLGLLRRAVDNEGVTVVMVSHDPLAAAVSDRLLLLLAGRIVDDRPTPDAASIAALLRAVSGASTPAAPDQVAVGACR
jgi:putative ABC transport system ATP-binding protein